MKWNGVINFSKSINNASGNVRYLVMHKGSAFPTTPAPVAGQMFYRTDINEAYIYDGSSWQQLFQSKAIKVSIDDTGNYFISGNVENALQEIGATLSNLTASQIKVVDAGSNWIATDIEGVLDEIDNRLDALESAPPVEAGKIKDSDEDTYVDTETNSDEDKIRFVTQGIERAIIDDSGNIGIGTSVPTKPFHVNGEIRFVDGSEGMSKSLISDPDGVAHWERVNDLGIYKHVQGGVANVWTINHVLDTVDLIFTAYDSVDTQIIPSKVIPIDNNTLQIEFSSGKSGKVIVAGKNKHCDMSTAISLPSTSWLINHNLNSLDLIILVTDGEYQYDNEGKLVFGEVILPDSIIFNDANNITINFSSATSGDIKIWKA